MRVVPPTGPAIELGLVETAPTIGITDYSRRVTDDYGVTTVVQRGFSRTMSVKLGLPFDSVDALQRQLAGLRATPALWVTDDRFKWLSAQGFYKEFSLDLNVPPFSYCTLTVEGLAETEVAADAGGDPAPEGMPSTLQLLQPVAVTDAVLTASSAPENDAPEWSAQTAYPSGAQVKKTATHRVYENVVAGNVGDDPAAASGKWLDLGPTNRWAMFDQALGTATTASGSIVVTLSAGAVQAVALLDVVASTLRVQGPGYDRTLPVGGGTMTFLDLPGSAGSITVTIAGAGDVSVGTLLVGRLVQLGLTEASPSAGITDYSRKVVDDFGAVTVVQRVWAKSMTAAALIRTDAIDVVANRIAAVRAVPSLWIGQAGIDSLTVYGFFKDFSIEVGESVSKLSLSIEGLSAAAKITPLDTSVDWEDVRDPTGTKPANNADVTGNSTAANTKAVANRSSDEVVGDLDLNGQNYLNLAQTVGVLNALLLARTTLAGKDIGTVVSNLSAQYSDAGSATSEQLNYLGSKVTDALAEFVGLQSTVATLSSATTQSLQGLTASVGDVSGSINDLRSVVVDADGNVAAKAVFALDAAGRAAGIVATNTGKLSRIELLFDAYHFLAPSGASIFLYSDPAVGGDGKVHMPGVVVDTLEAGSVKAEMIASSAVQKTSYFILPNDVSVPRSQIVTVASITVRKDYLASTLRLNFSGNFWSADDIQFSCSFVVDNTSYTAGAQNIVLDSTNSNGRMSITPFTMIEQLPAGDHVISFNVLNSEVDNINLTVKAGSILEVIELKQGAR